MEDNEYAAIDSSSSEDSSSKRYRITNSIEIPLLLVMVSVAVSGVPTSNLILYRTCVHALNHSVPECRPFLSPDKQGTLQDLETEVQEYANIVNTVSSVLGSVVPAVLSLFIGVWSDKHGRKPLIMWSLMGLALNAMLLVVYNMMPSLGPWWLVAFSVFFSLFGGFSVLVIGTMCFIADVTDDANRSFRLVVIQMIFAAGMAAGGMASPYILRAAGSTYLFLSVAALHTVAYAFSAVVLEESLIGYEEGSIFTVLDLSHIKDMAKECVKKRQNHGRPKLLLTVSATTFSTFTVYGAAGLMYLYTRNKLQWTMKDYTRFASISTVWGVMGGFIGVAVLQKIFHISDLSLATIALLSCIAENITKATATTSWQMYLGSAVSFFGSVFGAMTRSFLTKMLPSQDIGKAFGLLGSTEAFCPLLSPLVYNALYALTLTNFPGAFLVLTAGIFVVALFFILIVKYLESRSTSVSYQLIDDDALIN